MSGLRIDAAALTDVLDDFASKSGPHFFVYNESPKVKLASYDSKALVKGRDVLRAIFKLGDLLRRDVALKALRATLANRKTTLMLSADQEEHWLSTMSSRLVNAVSHVREYMAKPYKPKWYARVFPEANMVAMPKPASAAVSSSKIVKERIASKCVIKRPAAAMDNGQSTSTQSSPKKRKTDAPASPARDAAPIKRPAAATNNGQSASAQSSPKKDKTDASASPSRDAAPVAAVSRITVVTHDAVTHIAI